MFYDKWTADRIFIQVPAQALVGKWPESFKEFPPRAKSASFSIEQVVEALMPKA
jgi:arylsulfatase